jgi:hypothetical protein
LSVEALVDFVTDWKYSTPRYARALLEAADPSMLAAIKSALEAAQPADVPEDVVEATLDTLDRVADGSLLEEM